MPRKTLPSMSALWERHELLYTEIFVRALQKLACSKCCTKDEDTISEALCPILTQVCYEEGRKRYCEIRTPDWEKAIQPILTSELKGGKTRKRPDFTCKWINPLATCPEEYEITLHIECKRLGKTTSRSWILNENYVTNGIMRFDSIEHEYGKRAFSGLMIGYIVSMSFDEIEKEIDFYYQKHYTKPAALVLQSADKEIKQYRQHIERCCVKPKAFDLVHIWIDLERTPSPID